MIPGDDDHHEPGEHLEPMPDGEKSDYGFGKTAPPDRVAKYRQIVEDMATARGTTTVPASEPEA